jgi:hypothetical protein
VERGATLAQAQVLQPWQQRMERALQALDQQAREALA